MLILKLSFWCWMARFCNLLVALFCNAVRYLRVSDGIPLTLCKSQRDSFWQHLVTSNDGILWIFFSPFCLRSCQFWHQMSKYLLRLSVMWIFKVALKFMLELDDCSFKTSSGNTLSFIYSGHMQVFLIISSVIPGKCALRKLVMYALIKVAGSDSVWNCLQSTMACCITARVLQCRSIVWTRIT